MKKRIFSILLCVCLLFTACGTAETGEDVAETETAAKEAVEETTQEAEADPEPAAAGETVKFGVYIPLTGSSAEVGENCLNSYNLAVEEINANGGINGKMVELVVEDSQNDAKQAVQIAQQFIEDETILAVSTGGSSSCDLAAAPYFQDAGLTLIAAMASNAAIPPTGDYIFSVAGRSTDETPFIIQKLGIEHFNATKIAVLYEGTEWGVGVNELAIELAPESGAEVVASEQFSPDEVDFSAMLSKVRNAEPEVVVIVSQYAPAALIVNQIAKMGWDVNVAGTPAIANKNFTDIVGENGDGFSCMASMVFVDEFPLSAAYAEIFRERYGVDPTNHACCYETLMILAAAANECGDNLTRETLKEAMQGRTYDGLNGTYTFAEDGSITRPYHIVEYQSDLGKWVKVG